MPRRPARTPRSAPTARTADRLALAAATALLEPVAWSVLDRAASAVRDRRAGARRSTPPPPEPGRGDQLLPAVCDWSRALLLVPAYREAAVLPRLRAELLAQGVPLDRVLVLVEQDEATRRAAVELGLPVRWSPRRVGKGAAVEAAVARAPQVRWFVTVDANVRLAPGSLTRVLTALQTGALDVCSGVKSEDARAEGAYWRFANPAPAGPRRSLAVVGELLGFDRDHLHPLALSAAAAGGRVGVDPRARTTEESASPRQQFGRRRRIVANTYRLVGHRPGVIAALPARDAAVYAMTKLWRVAAQPALGVALVALAAGPGRARRTRLLAAGQLAGSALYLAEVARDRRLPLPVSVLGQAVGMAPVVCAAAALDAVRGRGSAAWDKPDRAAVAPVVPSVDLRVVRAATADAPLEVGG
jgi:hypothetical protein